MKSVACVGIDAGGEPVDHHVPDVAARSTSGVLVVRRQRVPVGDEEEARVLVLQPHPVLQRAVVVAEVQRAGRAHAGKHAIREHGQSERVERWRHRARSNGCRKNAERVGEHQREQDEETVGLEARVRDRHPVRQQADDDAPAVERRQRQQVERHQHEVHARRRPGRSRQKNVSSHAGTTSARFSTSAQPIAIARFDAGPGGGDPHHVALGLCAGCAKLTGTGFAQPNRKPAPPARSTAADDERHDDGADRVDVLHRIEGHAAEHVRRRVAEHARHVAVRRLVQRDAEDHRDRVDEMVWMRWASPFASSLGLGGRSSQVAPVAPAIRAAAEQRVDRSLAFAHDHRRRSGEIDDRGRLDAARSAVEHEVDVVLEAPRGSRRRRSAAARRRAAQRGRQQRLAERVEQRLRDRMIGHAQPDRLPRRVRAGAAAPRASPPG